MFRFRPVTKTLLSNIEHKIDEIDADIMKLEFHIKKMIDNKEGF